MKMLKLFAVFSMLLICVSSFSQGNVGIDVATPTEALSVARGINIDHNNQNTGAGLVNGLKFGNAATTSQLVGISSNRAGATQPFSLDFYTANARRMIITQNGLVGINIMPTNYYFEVGGTVKATTLRSAGSIYAEAGGINASTSVSAGTNVIAENNITATSGNITASTGDIVATNGELKADGRGVVMSNNATRQKIVAYTATLGVSGLGAGSSATGTISISAGTFSAAPTAYVGNVLTENGDYYKVTLVLENVTTTNITIRIFNPTSSPVSFSGAQWRILAVGPF